jgi:prophage tail gpP-like protein
MVLEIYDRIRVRRLTYFTNYEIHMKYDSIGSTFKFDYYFDPNNPEHKELSCVGHYHIATLKEGDRTLMTGFILSIVFDDHSEEQLVSISGYSLPGVLQDCEVPFGTINDWFAKKRPVIINNIVNNTWPGTLQSNGLSLREVAEKILNPFQLTMVIDPSVAADMEKPYDETTAKESQTAKSYICELAAQKNIIVTDDEFGRVVFTRPKKKKAILQFVRGDKAIPGTKMNLAFNGQGMHSHIKAIQQNDIYEDIPTSNALVDNQYVPFVFRPHVCVQNSGDANDTIQAAKNVRAKELKNMPLTIETDRWGVNGVIFRVGDFVEVTNPKLYLYKASSWFIEELTLKGDPEKAVATMHCVVPEVYTGEEPAYIFKGINLHG